MCGICGYVLPPGDRDGLPDGTLRRMRDTLTHRGPDDAGLYEAPGVGLGHRRLSIVDVAGGHQPMALEGTGLRIVYNGEVYNHLDLRRELEERGHEYETRCDTETVLRAFAEDGRASAGRLRGMFAFAVWDPREARLSLVRDRLGIKPLYYHHAPGGALFFASEIKALVDSGAVKPVLDHAALPDYLANHAPSGEETLFEGIRRLPPGHVLEWRDGSIRIEPFWKVPVCPGTEEDASDDELVERFRALLTESVRVRLMADVPLGAFLSGGIDSAAITALMAGMVDEPIKTFSVAFAEREANELGYARMVAGRFGTDHHEIVMDAGDFFGALPRLVWHEDEPVAHPSSVPLYFVARLAAERAKVVLTGEGSDELLGGYGWHWKTRLNLAAGRRWEAAVPGPLRGLVGAGVRRAPGDVGRKLRRTFLGRPADLRSLYLDNFAVFSAPEQAALLSASSRERIGSAEPYAHVEGLLEATAHCSLLQQLLYVDVHTFLHELLMKQDQMSMAASLESRVPFLDHHLVEFAARLPDRLKVRGWATKRILRKSMQGLLPEEILSRKKMGFPVPVGRWFRGEFRRVPEMLLEDRTLGRDLLEPAEVHRLVGEHLAGRANHWLKLWSLVTLEVWARIFLDGEAHESVAAPWSRRAGASRPVAAGGRP